MKLKILQLYAKRKAAQEHSGIIKVKAERAKIKKISAAKTTIAKENKKEYKLGCEWIKKILEFKKENKMVYVIGKQAPLIFKKYPELDNPSTIKNILIASTNSEYGIVKINSLVKDLYSKSMQEKERKEVILTMIKSIKFENYEYLLY